MQSTSLTWLLPDQARQKQSQNESSKRRNILNPAIELATALPAPPLHRVQEHTAERQYCLTTVEYEPAMSAADFIKKRQKAKAEHEQGESASISLESDTAEILEIPGILRTAARVH